MVESRYCSYGARREDGERTLELAKGMSVDG